MGKSRKLDNPIRFTIVLEADMLEWFRTQYGAGGDNGENVIQDVIRELLNKHKEEIENKVSNRL
jgi:hypothetical protein